MAAFSYDDYGASDDGGAFATFLNWSGAILSLVLIAGLATWGWKLWVRDVTGVPVVRALEGPMRVAPEDPGGLASEYQGLTVNRIAEDSAAVAPSERVVLAPQPATLNEDEDLAMSELPAVAPEPEEEVVLVEVAPTPDIGTAESFTVADVEPLEAAPATETVAAVETAVPTIEPEPAQSATDLAVAAALSDLGLKPETSVTKIEAAAHVPVVTPRPVVRPTNLQRVSLVTPAAPVLQEGEVDIASIASGTRLVQLGAFASPDVARAEWGEIEARYGDYFADKSRVIQQVDTGGREFYRLRVMGFGDLADARRFCSVIVADGTNCIPVIHQ